MRPIKYSDLDENIKKYYSSVISDLVFNRIHIFYLAYPSYKRISNEKPLQPLFFPTVINLIS